MSFYRSDIKAHRELFERLQSLIVSPDRTAWRDFCQIDYQNPTAGCAKYKQCPKHVKQIDDRCWDKWDRNEPTQKYLPVLGSRVENLDKQWNVLGPATWCDQFELLKGRADLDKPIAAYSFGVICPDCEKRSGENETPLSGLFRQCSAPCPFTGCAVPKLIEESKEQRETFIKKVKNKKTKKNESNEPAPPLGCPYNPLTAKGGTGRNKKSTFLSNTYARVQCFITRNDFLQYQTQVLGLQMGFFAFIGIRSRDSEAQSDKEIVYLARDPYKEIQLTQMVYDPSSGWVPDRYEHAKSYLFQASRELGSTFEGQDNLLTRLKGSSASYWKQSDENQRWRGLTQFDRNNEVLYVSDGEISAFCLRWLLEEAHGLWGENGIQPELASIIKNLWVASPKATKKLFWYSRNPLRKIAIYDSRDKENDPQGWKIEDYLIQRHLLDKDADLDELGKRVKKTRHNTTEIPPIVKYMGFGEKLTHLDILEALGIIVRATSESESSFLATERFWRLIKYLQRYHTPDVSGEDLSPAIPRLIDLAIKAMKAGRFPQIGLLDEDCQNLLKWIAMAPGLDPNKAPITRDGCVGHIMLRRSFINTDFKSVQKETCSRSWVAFPVFAYAAYHDLNRTEPKQVGFFLGTIDDADCYSDDGVLDADKLSEKLFTLKQWMILIGSVEAAGTYFEDIIARSEINKGIVKGFTDERNKWKEALNNSKVLQSVIDVPDSKAEPAEYVQRIDEMIGRRTDNLPLALKLALLYENSKMISLTHLDNDSGNSAYDSITECVDEIKKKCQDLADLIDDINYQAQSSELTKLLLAWKEPVEYASEDVSVINETRQILKAIISLKEKDFASLCSKQGTEWRIKSNKDGLLARLAQIRHSFKLSVSEHRFVEDYIMPFEKIYKERVTEISREISRKKSSESPVINTFHPPKVDGHKVQLEALKGYYIKQSSIVITEKLRTNERGDAQDIISRLFESSNNIKMINDDGLLNVIDGYVAVRKKNQFAMAQLGSNNWSSYVQQSVATSFKNSRITRDDGIYWVLVVPGLEKRF